jgi:plastin-1
MKCMENCSYAVEIGTSKLGYSLVGINGANIFEMDRIRTLALLWQLMRSFMTKVLSSMNGEIRDVEIQQWCNDTLKKHGKKSKVNSFKDRDLGWDRKTF